MLTEHRTVFHVKESFTQSSFTVLGVEKIQICFKEK